MINHYFWIIVKPFPVLGGSSYLVVGTERGKMTLVNHFLLVIIIVPICNMCGSFRDLEVAWRILPRLG